MKVSVSENTAGKGMALAISESGTKLLVQNGDLFLGQKIDIDLIADNVGCIRQFNYDIKDLLNEFGDKDGLIDCKNLKEVSYSSEYDRIFQLKNYWFTPDRQIKNVVEILLNEDNLWEQSKIFVSNSNRYTISSGLPIYGLDFVNAIKKVIKTGNEISHFYCPDKKELSQMGCFADFLVKLNTTKRDVIEIQCWQAVENQDFLTYSHGELHDNGATFFHFDCAKHFVTQEERNFLFTKKQKLNRVRKQKYFRLDGKISSDAVFKLMKNFFPLDYLVDEYYKEK